MSARLRSAFVGLAMLATMPVRAIDMPAPNWFGRVVESHVRAMEQKNYYDRITTNGFGRPVGAYMGDIDFYHGHLLRVAGEEYADLDAFLRSAVVVLYHTQEFTRKWERERTNAERTPRSIVGYLNGTVQPAVDVVGVDRLAHSPLYEVVGTVLGADVASVFGITDAYDTYPMIAAPVPCVPQNQFFIVPSSKGRFSSDAQRFDVVITCTDPAAPQEPSILLRDPPTTVRIPDPFQIFHFTP